MRLRDKKGKFARVPRPVLTEDILSMRVAAVRVQDVIDLSMHDLFLKTANKGNVYKISNSIMCSVDDDVIGSLRMSSHTDDQIAVGQPFMFDAGLRGSTSRVTDIVIAKRHPEGESARDQLEAEFTERYKSRDNSQTHGNLVRRFDDGKLKRD